MEAEQIDIARLLAKAKEVGMAPIMRGGRPFYAITPDHYPDGERITDRFGYEWSLVPADGLRD